MTRRSQSTSANRTCPKFPNSPAARETECMASEGGGKSDKLQKNYKWNRESPSWDECKEKGAFPSPISAVTWRSSFPRHCFKFYRIWIIIAQWCGCVWVCHTVGACGADNNCERGGDEDVIGCEIARHHTHTGALYHLKTHNTGLCIIWRWQQHSGSHRDQILFNTLASALLLDLNCTKCATFASQYQCKYQYQCQYQCKYRLYQCLLFSFSVRYILSPNPHSAVVGFNQKIFSGFGNPWRSRLSLRREDIFHSQNFIFAANKWCFRSAAKNNRSYKSQWANTQRGCRHKPRLRQKWWPPIPSTNPQIPIVGN